MHFFTIGAFNSSAEDFYERLFHAGIDTFCDLRQRRGVRGAQYSFVNSKFLQYRLQQLGIRYIYIPQLAPSNEIRKFQKQTDDLLEQTNKNRQTLDENYIRAYRKLVLDVFDFPSLLQELQQSGARRIALFCVEQFPDACHRSLVGKWIKEGYGFELSHL